MFFLQQARCWLTFFVLQMQDNSMNQSAANPNGFSNQSNNDSSASVALRSLADQQSRSCPNQSNDQPDSNQYNYGAKCEGSPYDQMGQVRMGPPPSYQEVVPPSRQVSGSHGFNESEGNAIGNSPKMSPLMYSNGDGQVPFGQKGLTNANYRAVTPPANMSSNMRGTNNMEACDSLSALQMSLNKRSTLLGLNGANATRPSGGPFQQTMASNPQPVPGELRMGQMQMGNVRPQQQQQQQQQVGQFNQRNLATPLNISAPSQIFPQNNEFAGGGQQQMVMSSKQQQMLLQCGTFPAGMQRPDQRFMGDGGQMYLQAEHQQQNLIIQQGGKMAGSAGQPHLFPQEIPNNMAGYSAQRQQQFTGFPEGMNRGNVMRGGPGMMPQVVVSDPFSSMPSNPQQQRFAAAQHPQFVQTGPSMFAKGGATIGEEMKMFTAAPTKKGRLVNNATGRVVPPNVSVVAPTMDNFRFGPQEAGRPMFFEVDGQMVRQGGGMQDPMASYASYDGRPVPMAQQQQHQMMQQSQRHMEFVQNGQSGQRGINFMQMEQSQQAAMRFSAADRQIAMQQQQQFSHMSGGPGGISQAQMEMQMRSSASMQMASGPNPNMRGNPFPQGPGGNGRGKPPGPLSMNDPNMYSYM